MTSVLAVRDLHVEVGEQSRAAHALRGVDLDLLPGTITGLVGETGSGKTLTALALLGLLPPPARVLAGSVRWEGRDLLALREQQWERIRGREIAMVFQNARAALHPLLSVGRQLVRIRRLHGGGTEAAARKEALRLLEAVGFSDAARHLDAHPHQLSGGQCQRVMIAMALLCRPKVLIADEPTSALDVTVQQQLVAALSVLVRESGTTLLFISHDLGVVGRLCDFVAVMYAGQVVEYGARREVLAQPAHPYTRALLRCLQPSGRRVPFLPGALPDPRLPLRGCAFVERCDEALELCTQSPPDSYEPAPGRRARCFLHRPPC